MMVRALASWGAAVLAAAAVGVSAQAETVAITGGRVVTNTDAGVLSDAIVVFDETGVLAVGPTAPIPADARVIDAKGRWVTPGVFAPFTQLGLTEIDAEDATNDELGETATASAALRAEDGFNPRGSTIAAARIEGVTRALVAPSTASAAFIAGQSVLARLDGGADSVFERQTALYVRLDDAGVAAAGGSRLAAWAKLRAAFTDARSFPARYITQVEGDALNRVDAEAFRPFARGEAALLIRVSRADDIQRVLDLLVAEPALNIILIGAEEAAVHADALARAGIPVIIDPTRNLPGGFDTLGASRRSAAALIEAGVAVAFIAETTSGGANHNARLLPQIAGNAVSDGVSWDDAFASISSVPADIYGVGDRLGRLAPGYAADVVIWDGDPLEVMSAPTAVFIDGAETSLTSRQTKLRDRYKDLSAIQDFGPGYRKP